MPASWHLLQYLLDWVASAPLYIGMQVSGGGGGGGGEPSANSNISAASCSLKVFWVCGFIMVGSFLILYSSLVEKETVHH